MADNAARPPVAVRIVRPYDTEESFLESELETVGKTSVILIGAHPRPTGVILRFEVTLADGNVVLRGEGRVLAHKESAFRGQPGLALRFTRLDPKSKALVDRAAAIREARLSGSMPPQPVPTPPAAESSSAPVIESASAPSVPPPSVPPPPPSSRPEGARTEHPAAPTVPPNAPTIPPAGSMPPHFASMSNIPAAPVNATIAPDPMLADLLTAPTPPPPPPRRKSERPTSKPPPDVEVDDEAKTPPPMKAVAPILDEPPAPNVHVTKTVAAPPLPSAPEPVVAPPPPPAPKVVPPPPPPPTPKVAAPMPKVAAPPPENSAVTRVADRDAILARLRERRASMSDEEKEALLKRR